MNYDLPSVMEKLREAMRQQGPTVKEIFRRFDKDHNGVITVEEMKEACQKFALQKTVTVEMLHAALLRLGLAFDLDDIERSVLFLMPGVDPAAIPYFEFLQALNCSYHDLAATR